MVKKIKKNKEQLIGVTSILMVCFMTGAFIFFPAKSHGLGKEALAKQEEALKEKEAKEQSKGKEESSKYPDLPDVKSSDWELALVNAKHPIEKEADNLVVMPNGYEIDARVAEQYYKMEAAAKEEGINLVVISSYRSVAAQEEVYNNGVQERLNMGMSEEEAKKSTEDYITVPGTSEHHTGLAMDVVDDNWAVNSTGLEAAFYNTPAGKWIDEHAAKFGFVIRYPESKANITNINYEPWHLRYVGVKSAEFMTKNKLVLEEYLDILNGNHDNVPVKDDKKDSDKEDKKEADEDKTAEDKSDKEGSEKTAVNEEESDKAKTDKEEAEKQNADDNDPTETLEDNE
ncbi:M15 family metallopeptidase [Vagococcus coleopterorum]|uniref:M15 family metallopeptidase n=1 Tax=Vagococcus coleopterorum TaxID=2714946 RepID=A0A6G8APC9_9ENTE|nr:M15 family metallopeptidase [Vagococcus coleopterorum]QIL46934.1 M15 family metallopeptidase [Vagococcus coleopterorum]